MKKQLCLILCLFILLSGCSSQPEKSAETTPPSRMEETAPSVPDTQPEETTEALDETLPPETDPPETEPEMAPPETEPVETKPQQKPTQTTPQQKPTQTTPQQTPDTPTVSQKPNNAVLQFKHRQQTIPLKEWSKLEFTYTGSGKPELYATSPGLVLEGDKAFPRQEGRWTVYLTDGVYEDTMEVIVPSVSETLKGDIYFEQPAITLAEGENTLLSVKGDIRGEYVSYTSSNPGVATVSGGFLLAAGPGTATITAKHYHRIATMTVTVTPDPSIVRIDVPDTLTVYVRHSAQLEVSYNGTQTLAYDSDDETVAGVTADGTVYGVSPGTCEIFVSDRSIGEGCIVTVLPDPNWKPTAEIKTANFTAPLYDGVVMEVGDVMSFQAWNVPDESYGLILVDIGDYNSLSVDWTQDSNDVYTIYLVCNDPCTTTLTLTSEDGNASLSYTITVVKKR